MRKILCGDADRAGEELEEIMFFKLRKKEKEVRRKRKALKRIKKVKGTFFVCAFNTQDDYDSDNKGWGVVCAPPELDFPAVHRRIGQKVSSLKREDKLAVVRKLTDFSKENGGQTWFDLQSWRGPAKISLINPEGRCVKTFQIKNRRGVVIVIRSDRIEIFKRRRR